MRFKFALLFSLLFLLLHLSLLNYSPIVWYDEVCLASETHAFNKTGKIVLEANPFVFKGEINHYGPIYFWITSFFTKHFGFNVFQNRIQGVLFGFSFILLFYKLCSYFINNKKIVILAIITLATENFIFSSMHNGRMEMIAISFLFGSYILLFEGIKDGQKKYYILSGVLLSLAYLTTPRVLYLIFPLSIIVIDQFIIKREKFIIEPLLLLGSIALIVLVWILFKFGTISNYLETYLSLKNKGFVGMTFHPNKIQYPLIIVTGITVIYSLFKNKLLIKDSKFLFLLASVVLFYLFVVEIGPYNVFNIPFYILLIGYLLDQLTFREFKYKFTIFYVLLGINISILVIKSTIIFTSLDNRSPYLLEQFIKKNIPSNSSIIGDSRYYYGSIRNNCKFYYIDVDYSYLEFKKLYDKELKYDYIFLSNDQITNDVSVISTFITEDFEVVEKYTLNSKPLNLNIGNFRLLPSNLSTSYEGVLYRRKAISDASL